MENVGAVTPEAMRLNVGRAYEGQTRAKDEQDTRRRARDLVQGARILDGEDLADILDQGNQASRYLVLRRKLLKVALAHLPSGAMLYPHEQEELRKAVETNASRVPSRDANGTPVPAYHVQEWNP